MALTDEFWHQEDVEWSRFTRASGFIKEEAFLTKSFIVTLEQGDFITQYDALGASDPPHFNFRLVFDPSPYPPREQWKDTARPAADALKFWEWNEFCSRQKEQDPSTMNWILQFMAGSKKWLC